MPSHRYQPSGILSEEPDQIQIIPDGIEDSSSYGGNSPFSS